MSWSRWWRLGATVVAMGYVVTSQALMDLPGWSTIGFGFGLLLVVLLGLGNLYQLWRIQLDRWMWMPAAFVGYSLLRSFSTIRETAPLDVWMSLASAFLVGLAIAAAMQAGVRFKAIVYAQLASCLCQLALILLGLGPEPAPGEEADFRYAGITGNANELALQLTLGACLVWLLPRKAGVVAGVAAFGSVGAALALTGSRKAVLIALFFVALVLLQAFEMALRRRRGRWLACLAVCFALAGLVALTIVVQHGQELLAVQRSLAYQDSSYQIRAQMIEQAIQLWRQNPLFGHGLDAFRGLSGQGTYAHNNYVELLCDTGLVGVVLFYGLHLQIAIRAARLPRRLKLACLLCVLMLVVADVGYVSYKRKQTVMILTVLATVATARHRSHRFGGSARAVPADRQLPVAPQEVPVEVAHPQLG